MTIGINVAPNILLIEEVADCEHHTSGGIIVQSRNVTPQYTIRHIHPDTASASNLNVGDKIYVTPYATADLVMGTQRMLAVTVGDVLAKVTTDVYSTDKRQFDVSEGV